MRMRINRLGITIAITAIGLVAAAGTAAADGAKLLESLTSDLGITEDQAIGGTKALLDVAKENLGEDEFGQLLGEHPDLGDLSQRDHGLAKGAAKAVADGGVADMAKEMAGDGGLAALAKNADLVQQFSDLGMDTGMLEKFAGKLLDAVGGGGALSGLTSPKTKLLRKGLGLVQ